MTHLLLCPLLPTASRSAVSGHSYPTLSLLHGNSMVRGDAKRHKTQRAGFVSGSCSCVVVRKTGEGDHPPWPLSVATADTSLVTEQLQTAAHSSQHLSLQTEELLTGHQCHTQALDIYCPQFYSMALTASSITRKKKLPALPGALPHVFLPADTTHFSVLIPDLSGGGRATLGDHHPHCWKDNGLVSRQPVSSLALPPT